MASEKQIAANRRNARNSTGPRSSSGKKRASQNALRHGLARPISSAAFDREVEALALQFAGEAADKPTVELARAAAEAEFELARVRRVKIALIERVAALGQFDDFPQLIQSIKDELASMAGRSRRRPKFAVDPPPMPSQEPDRTAEAIRRSLPELVKLRRYESRAALRRDRSIRAIALRWK
jgi:hypothetical protein